MDPNLALGLLFLAIAVWWIAGTVARFVRALDGVTAYRCRTERQTNNVYNLRRR